METKVYSRYITKRVKINHFGKLGFKRFIEYVKTYNIHPFNFRKQTKFEVDNNIKGDDLELNRIYCEEIPFQD